MQHQDEKITNSYKTFAKIFNSLFPIQNNSWKEYTIPKKIWCKVTSVLLGKPLIMELWMKITWQEKNTGSIGESTEKCSKQTHTWNNVQIYRKSSSSQHLLQGSGQATMAREILSEFSWLQRCLQPSQRPSNWLENRALYTKQKNVQGLSGTAHLGIQKRGPTTNATTCASNCGSRTVLIGRRKIKQHCTQSNRRTCHNYIILPLKSRRIHQTKTKNNQRDNKKINKNSTALHISHWIL